MNLKQCPHCKEEALIYTHNADIDYELENGKLVAKPGICTINWMDRTELWCSNCLLSHKDNFGMYELKQKYDNLLQLQGKLL